MRAWFLIFCTLILVFVIARCLVRREPMRWLSIGLLALVIVPNLGFEIVWVHTQAVASKVVRDVSGKAGGYAYCERVSEAFFDGGIRSGEVVSNEPDKAFLAWQTCEDFKAFLFSNHESISESQLIAVHVIVHEAIHVSGDYNEASTECKAMAQDARILMSLGMSSANADAAALRYRTGVYPRLGSEYRSNCSS
jgi:hypothetical protein